MIFYYMGVCLGIFVHSLSVILINNVVYTYSFFIAGVIVLFSLAPFIKLKQQTIQQTSTVKQTSNLTNDIRWGCAVFAVFASPLFYFFALFMLFYSTICCYFIFKIKSCLSKQNDVIDENKMVSFRMPAFFAKKFKTVSYGEKHIYDLGIEFIEEEYNIKLSNVSYENNVFSFNIKHFT